MSALAQQQQMHFVPPQAQKLTTLFVGSISGGITDAFLNQLLAACGPVKSFKRLITPANKPQGFGFAEFEEPDGALRALTLMNGIELPALEDGCANKKLLVKADEKTRAFLDAYQSQRMVTSADDAQMAQSKAKIDELVADINRISQDAANNGLIDKEKYVIPPHLHDLQEADLPETQRGLVISEIAQFRERAAKREREKLRDVRESIPQIIAPSGPKVREWGKPQGVQQPSTPAKKEQGYGKGAQGYNKPVGFVKAEEGGGAAYEDKGKLAQAKPTKTDEELEEERKEARRREEEISFRDRERRYEPRERTRIQALERAIARERATREAEERQRIEMRERLHIWDDDESDEMFYIDRARWRSLRARRLEAEEAADEKSRRFEEQEAENLRRESEDFLARQMDEMQALAEEQRKAGLLLDDGAPVKLNVSIAAAPTKEPAPKEKATVFGQEEEDEDAAKKRKISLVKLDFSVAESGEQTKERLERIRRSVPTDKETLFKSKVRWDGLSDTIIDRKFEPLVKRLMIKYLGEMEEEDLIMFVLEHLKDHKGPQKLVEGLEPVLEEEAVELTVSVWRQVIFESMAYNEGLLTDKMLVD
ncbi:putative PWI domain containing protein [Lyophyllum shimeji]|uniref:PWI domain containing protein n=1 Tax=Lyophyllum shimeji TaxID=47721 RepID=A0A9P3UKV8_LYOSH|nr:putative PWI domain containing protein [Lyophyllum shimeji]